MWSRMSVGFSMLRAALYAVSSSHAVHVRVALPHLCEHVVLRQTYLR